MYLEKYNHRITVTKNFYIQHNQNPVIWSYVLKKYIYVWLEKKAQWSGNFI